MGGWAGWFRIHPMIVYAAKVTGLLNLCARSQR